MENSTDRARARAEALRRVADDHGLSPNARTTAGEDLAADLTNPGRLEPWCAVTYSIPDGGARLDPHYTTSAAARRSAERCLDDPAAGELPLEVVDLDSAARQIARLGIFAWDSPHR